MRKLTSLALLAVTATLVAQSANAQSLSIGFEPSKSRYARGERMTIAVTFRNAWGQPCPYTWIQVGSRDDFYRSWSWGWYCTNGSGQVRIGYTVPTDVRRDNVYIGACFPSWGTFNQKRIPIGL